MGIILSLILVVLYIIGLAMFGRMIMSFIDPQRRSAFSRFLNDITEPIISPVRSVVPPVGMFDLAFLITAIMLSVLIRLISPYAAF